MTEEELNKLFKKFLETDFLKTPLFYGPKENFFSKSKSLSNTVFNLMSGNITIEKGAFFGHNCCVITGSHDYTKFNGHRKNTIPKDKNHIHIKTGVWIGTNATILGPCTIGDHSVIAAGSVLLPGEYDSYTVYGGVPAKKLKTITQNS
jgi:acetyltransferase-like isoleucine patch superfamily enzyme